MIITKIMGGIGNQMFQYAYGRHLSQKYNTKLYLDDRFYKNTQGSTNRSFLLNKFQNTEIDTRLDMIQNNHPIHRIVDTFVYIPLQNPIDFNYYLDGYWQSEKYFKESESIIREDFSPSSEIVDKLKLKYTQLNFDCISMHIRRTDYVTSNGYHTVQPIEYYQKAYDIINDTNTNVLVFSDDIKWCKENLKFDSVFFIEGEDEITDMYIMSLCGHNIIANSSFSWWGAWLNKNSDKKVISPINWFGTKANLSDSDIIPKDWIRI